MPHGFIDIVGSSTGTLYIGVTSDLYVRFLQHRNGTYEGFSKRYSCKRLLYFEEYGDTRPAIAREKQLEGWRREKKLNLIRCVNPDPGNLGELWGSTIIGPDQSIHAQSRSC